MAFTDDDVVFAADYVREIRTVFQSLTVDAAQGRALFDCKEGRPKWLSESYAACGIMETELSLFPRWLPLTFLLEPCSGKNAPLNAGLASIEGDLVVFTDDDTLPRPNGLVELRRAAFFGGTVLPCWEVTPQHWITAFRMGGALSC